MYINVVNVVNWVNFIYNVYLLSSMEGRKNPVDITLQRISYGNIDRIEKLGKAKHKDSFNDIVTRLLDEFEECKKEVKRLKSDNKK